MPRARKNSAERRAARAQSQAQWRARIATSQNNSQLDNSTTTRFINQTVKEEPKTGVYQLQLSEAGSSIAAVEHAKKALPITTRPSQIDPSEVQLPEAESRETCQLQSSASPSVPSLAADEGIQRDYLETQRDERGWDNAYYDDSQDDQHNISAQAQTESEEEIEPKEQLHQELSLLGLEEDPETNLALELGLHLLNFHGCGAESHHQQALIHFDNDQIAKHYSLDDFADLTKDLPDVIGNAEIADPQRLLGDIQPDWARLFEGKDDRKQARQASRIHICVASSEQPSQPRHAEFDIDSVVGFANSLAFARRGFKLDLAPQFHSNIQTNLHVSSQVHYDFGRGLRPVWVKVHDIPHYCLGRVFGHEHVRVYVLFPNQWTPDKQSNFPGKLAGEPGGILRKWTDEILLPALAMCLPSSVAQHLPGSFLNAQLAAKAYNHEALAKTDKTASRHQSIAHLLQPRFLETFWNEIQDQVNKPENHIFKDVQLLFNSKNTKCLYKYSTLAETWEAYEADLQAMLDFSYIDPARIWLDVGKEAVCQDWSLSNQRPLAACNPSTYLWRSCCLSSFYNWSLHGASVCSATKCVYNTALLAECNDMTIEMSRNSTKQQQGWVYSQFYSSAKEMYDAANTKPFRSPFLERLAWDPKILAMVDHEGSAVTTTASRLKGSFLKSKTRLANSLHEGKTKSYGVREEHRISLAFLRKMKASLEDAGSWDSPADTNTSIVGRPYWELSTNTYTSFLNSNVNKFLFAFELILAQAEDGHISYERSKILSMLLDSIKYCYDSAHLQRVPGLWVNKAEARKSKPTVQGMGLQVTMTESGYGWYLPKIDWENFVFRAEQSPQMCYSNTLLRTSHRKRWVAVRDVKDDIKRMDVIGRWLKLYKSSQLIQDFLRRYITTLVLRHFRKKVFLFLKKSLRPEFKSAALAGNVMLCWASLKEALVPYPARSEGEDPARSEGEEPACSEGEEPSRSGSEEPACSEGEDTVRSGSEDAVRSEREDTVRSEREEPARSEDEEICIRIVNSNRSKLRSVKDLADFLWDFDDNKKRVQWSQYTYRLLYQRALEIVKASCGVATAHALQDQIKRTFIMTAWIIPLPSPYRFWEASGGYRRCFSVYNADLLDNMQAGQHVAFRTLSGTTEDNTSRGEQGYMCRWKLQCQASKGCTMTCIPQEDSSPFLQPGVSLTEIGQELERRWEESKPEED